ncbi:ATPase family protein associated with various cellular activities (AAA) [Janthinobacterium sp. 35]|uniref:ATP-binding protein n=1 Tax=Janthinobacterium sp. 35 TaxID=2035210 RepID=UPI000C193E7C|nr:ATP-binding protein [Janthinobacterium sp. 35]PIG31035.1 ATPase family protein associated with various cellular activities (AAA) [Janthinobacterium sp. 35]
MAGEAQDPGIWPLGGKTGLVSMTVTLNGHAMPDDYAVESIHVTRELNRLGTARIVLADGDPSTVGFELGTADTLLPGVTVEVAIGYHPNISTVFKGIIVKHGMRIGRQGGSQLVLSCAEVAIEAPVLADNSCGLLLTCGESIIAFNAELDAGTGVRGTVSFPGNALAVSGKTIELAGLGARFDGDVYIARVEHTLEHGNWMTEVTFGLPPRCVASDSAQVHAPAAPGFMHTNTLAMSKDGVALCGETRLSLGADEDIEITAAKALEAELAWLDAVIAASMAQYFQRADASRMPEPPTLPAHAPYALALRKWGLSAEERLVLILALAPHVRPQALDSFLIRNASLDLPFSEFGGQGGSHRGFWPTAETASFLLAGDRLAARMATHRLFGAGAPLRRLGLLAWDEWPADGAAPRTLLGHPLQLGREALSLLVTGESCQPDYDGGLPARRLSTTLDWDQLVLAPQLQDKVDDIRAWIEHRDTLLRGWGLERRIKPGFRSLFYGPPGTGKSLTAALLGKQSGLPVYRIDLSMLVSTYTGETEKNLARVFEQAGQQDWILFFDAADALFGKRGANEDVARLLQRIEDFPGVAILASNLNVNIDEACAGRFQSMLHFPMPGRTERLRLWQGAFAPPCRLAPDCALDALADEFELSGGAIINVLRHAALACLRRGSEEIGMDDVRQGVRRELRQDACLPLAEKRC